MPSYRNSLLTGQDRLAFEDDDDDDDDDGEEEEEVGVEQEEEEQEAAGLGNRGNVNGIAYPNRARPGERDDEGTGEDAFGDVDIPPDLLAQLQRQQVRSGRERLHHHRSRLAISRSLTLLS